MSGFWRLFGPLAFFRLKPLPTAGSWRRLAHYWRTLLPLGESPQAVVLPATSAILAVATIESYINELVGMAPFGDSPTEKEPLQQELRQLGTDVVAKLRRLRALSANSDGFPRTY